MRQTRSASAPYYSFAVFTNGSTSPVTTPRRRVADAVGTRTDRLSYPLDLDGTLMRRLVFGVLVSSLAGCGGVTSPIVPAINSKSAFAGAKGTTTTFKQPYPDYKVYRVFIQGESMSAVIKDALEQASDFCGSNGERMDTLQETVANPPYGRGNPPRIEYVFQCVRGPMKSQL